MAIRILSNLDIGFADLIHRDLREQGYHVVGFDYDGSTTDFIATFDNEAFDLMLLDLGPPIPDQRSILDRILRETDNAPVVLFNALPNDWARLTSDLDLPIVGPRQEDFSLPIFLALFGKFVASHDVLLQLIQESGKAPDWQRLVGPARIVAHYSSLLMGSEYLVQRIQPYLKHVHLVSQTIIVTAMNGGAKIMDDLSKIAQAATDQAIQSMVRDDREIDLAALESAWEDMAAAMVEIEALHTDAEAARVAARAKLDELTAATRRS